MAANLMGNDPKQMKAVGVSGVNRKDSSAKALSISHPARLMMFKSRCP
jgi:hypothetical protein